jgi:penicillin-binding protein 1C
MALALRIEWSLDKREILEQYLNRIAFGPSLRGIEAASRFYFDKPTADLSLAEAASLASLPRGPSLYDPSRGTERLARRRDRVLSRMRDSGLGAPDEIARAMQEPLVIARTGAGLGAPHLVRGLLSGSIDPSLGSLRNRESELTLTIDRSLQREFEVLAQKTIRALDKKHVSAATLVVIENATGEILAYVGSPDIEDAAPARCSMTRCSRPRAAGSPRASSALGTASRRSSSALSRESSRAQAATIGGSRSSR